jgi:hypothetical protein
MIQPSPLSGDLAREHQLEREREATEARRAPRLRPERTRALLMMRSALRARASRLAHRSERPA